MANDCWALTLCRPLTWINSYKHSHQLVLLPRPLLPLTDEGTEAYRSYCGGART